MGKGNFTEDFKRDAVAQIVDRGYPVAEVSRRLGVSQHSLYGWKKKFAKAGGSSSDDRDAEIRRLKRELARVTEERDILKKATAYFAKVTCPRTFIQRLLESRSCLRLGARV